VTLIAKSWPYVGYETPNGHDRDVSKLEISIGAAGNSMEAFRAEWRCDEVNEELETDLAILSVDPLNPSIQERVRKLQERWNTNACARFEDD
jgi:hypothetical protein